MAAARRARRTHRRRSKISLVNWTFWAPLLVVTVKPMRIPPFTSVLTDARVELQLLEFEACASKPPAEDDISCQPITGLANGMHPVCSEPERNLWFCHSENSRRHGKGIAMQLTRPRELEQRNGH